MGRVLCALDVATAMSTPSITAADLDVDRIGSGPPVLLVQGSVVDARRTWKHQLELGERWALCIPNRPGFAGSPPLPRGDFEAEAPLFAELLGDGSHLVGHSYGAVIALLAAAARPHRVRSLVVSEPGSLRLAAGNQAVDEMIRNGAELYTRGADFTPSEFLRMFRTGVHSTHETPDELPEWLEHGARLALRERPPWEAEIPIADLAAASFPKLVISGGHSEAFEAVCDALANGIGAERAVVPGRAHTIPGTGEAYNSLVHDFMSRAEAARGPVGRGPSRGG